MGLRSIAEHEYGGAIPEDILAHETEASGTGRLWTEKPALDLPPVPSPSPTDRTLNELRNR